jgi:autotransporter-associated beta strand protein
MPRFSTHCSLTSLVPSLCAAVFLAALAHATLPSAHAITINMTYTDEGDDPPHPENPTWDPAGVILKQHFQAAKTIWESLLPGGGEYSFDFHWDNDISGLGLYTPGADEFIEINPDFDWFADPDPLDNAEFNAGVQTLYRGLSASEQTTYFPGATPPGALEVGYRGAGFINGTFVNGFPVNTLSASEQVLPGTATPVDASNGYDLLSTVLHEIGHALGLSGVEPGNYNIDPQHIGGIGGVEVLEGGGGHLAGQGAIPYLMCESCGTPGVRRIATATDVLVIAEDQGITVVQLARVGSIASGAWGTTNNWIGGDVPDSTQDVYISHGGGIALDVDAAVKNMLVGPGNSLLVGNRSITAFETITSTGGFLSVGSGGAIVANAIVGEPSSISSAAGSLVRFNQLTGTAATATSFGGSLAIGFDNIPGPLSPPGSTFNPTLANWSIGENLIIGDESFADLVVDNGIWTVNGNVTLGKVLTFLHGGWAGGIDLQNNGVMTVAGNLDIAIGAVTVEDTAALNVAGNITIGKRSGLTYQDDRSAASRPHSLEGGRTEIVEGTPIFIAGGILTFEDTANAADASVTLEGGSGANSAGALVVFKGNSSGSTGEFRTKGGHYGPSNSGVMQGNGGQVRFEGTSHAGTSNALYVNEGAQDTPPGGLAFVGGTGGRTVFTNNSSAEGATIHNHGATSIYVGGHPLGGATHFFQSSTAGSANITNFGDATYIYAGMEAKTIFYESSEAGNATIENLGATNQAYLPGQTEFRGNSSAGLSNIHNRAQLTPTGLAGRTLFYDNATAAEATIHTYEGISDMGRVEFHNQSTAARARIIVENVPSVPGNGGGYVIFRDNSTAAQSQIFLRAGTAGFGGINFHNDATAGDAQILTEDASGNIGFQGNSTAGDPADAPTAAKALFSLGRGSVMSFYDQSKAEDANISLAYGAQLQFQNNSSAGMADIVAAGSALYPWNGGAVTFNSASTINNATLTLHGATVPLGTGASALFNNGAHAGNATITAHGGTGGGGGATITFSNSYGDSAQIIANAGSTVDILIQPTFNNGNITLGSIEGAGKFVLRGSHLTTGARNKSTTVSGPIVDNPPGASTGGRLTKIGTGTLTLAGANTYTGLTTVEAGTLSVTGSIAGGAVVNNGGTLNGSGVVAGGVTVNQGGHFNPGTSPGTIAVGGLTMTPGATLNFELGNPARDRIVLTNNGNVTLDGLLNISLLDGFTPALGQTFPLIEGAIGSIAGTFDAVIAPIFNGMTLNVVQNANSVLLQAGPPTMLAGDFNGDGSVNGADLNAWKAGFGAPTGAAHSQGDSNADADADGADFLVWQQQFGSGPGAVPTVNPVPEPMALALVPLLTGALLIGGRKTLLG